jgi:hypothetical protein
MSKQKPHTMKLALVLGEMNRGAIVAQGDAELAKAIQAIREHGKTAEITIKVKIKPTGEHDEVEVTAEFSSKLPSPKLRAATFFMTDEGDLTREDPQQPDLPLTEPDPGKVVPGPTAQKSA